jgi:hypothetical protein
MPGLCPVIIRDVKTLGSTTRKLPETVLLLVLQRYVSSNRLGMGLHVLAILPIHLVIQRVISI